MTPLYGPSGLAAARRLPCASMAALTLVVLCACSVRTGSAAPSKPKAEARPPLAATHAHRVVGPAGARDDEYYWLRDDTRSRPEVLAYLRAENAYADALLAPLSSLRAELYTELRARIAEQDLSAPVKKHGFWYAERSLKGAEYPLHVRFADGPRGPEQIVLDENQRALGHGYFHLGDYQVTDDGEIVAWAEDTRGRGQYTIRFKNLQTGQELKDTLTNCEDTIAFTQDGRTLLYIEKDPETLLGFRVRSHVLGEPVDGDAVLYEERDHAYYLSVWRSRSGRYLHIYAHATDTAEQLFAPAAGPLRFSPILERAQGHEYSAEDHGDGWVIRTNERAPNFRVIEVSHALREDRSRWRERVPHPPHGMLEEVAVFNDFIAYTAREDGLLSAFYLPFDVQSPRRIALPEASYTVHLAENPEVDTREIRLRYETLTVPERDYAFDVSTQELKLLKEKPVLGGFRADHYESRYLHAPARDGAQVPVSIAYRKDTPLDGTAALYQLGYGAYGLSEDPEFASSRLSLLDRGVVLAIAHVRGGQELGRAWYDAGRLQHKKNSFYDFIDVTDFLVTQGFAARGRVAARGASAGGLLVGAVANLAPDRYRVMVAHVPFVDVVTTMLDESIPLTSNEYQEWGDPRRAADYAYMLSYSPYDNVRRGPYPALFVTTSLWDSQVQYFEPAKWVARLRARKTNAAPLVFRINMEGSHGGRSGRFTRLSEIADEYAFVLDALRYCNPPRACVLRARCGSQAPHEARRLHALQQD